MSGLFRGLPGVLVLLLATALCAHAEPAAQAPVRDTVAFDQLIRQLDNGEVALNSQASVDRTLDRLRALLPSNDAYRRRRYVRQATWRRTPTSRSAVAFTRVGSPRSATRYRLTRRASGLRGVWRTAA